MVNDSQYYTVSAINNYIAYKLSTDIALKLVYIKGELSNCRVSKGHIYFVLKDSESEISGVIFSNAVSRLNFMPKDGMQVLITGSITPYTKKGSYNLIVSEIKENGKGYLYQKFLETKEKLAQLGLFDSNHKKPIPNFPEKIGVITSATADALNDIYTTINSRFPCANIFLYPALVQGIDAPKSLIKALNKISLDNFVDVVIIARGGGSFEDLNCFNDETLAKAIYNFNIPIVSGVGHENDYTICDFVCDARAVTPTGAAIKVTPDKDNLLEMLDNANHKLEILEKRIIDRKTKDFEIITSNYYLRSFDNVLKEFNNKYEKLKVNLKLYSPGNILLSLESKLESVNNRFNKIDLIKSFDDKKTKIDQIEDNIYKDINLHITNLEQKFSFLINKLTLVNPLDIMKKGYSIVYKDEYVISSKDDVNINDDLIINFYDGKRKVKVIK